MNEYERREEALEKRYAAGEINNAEYWLELKEIQRDYRDAAREAAERAYGQELERW